LYDKLELRDEECTRLLKSVSPDEEHHTADPDLNGKIILK